MLDRFSRQKREQLGVGSLARTGSVASSSLASRGRSAPPSASALSAPTLPAKDAEIRSEPPGADGSPGGATQSLEGAQSGGELGLLQPMCLRHVNHCTYVPHPCKPLRVCKKEKSRPAAAAQYGSRRGNETGDVSTSAIHTS